MTSGLEIPAMPPVTGDASDGHGTMKRSLLLPVAAMMALALAPPALGQTRWEFFEAVRDGDFAIVESAVKAPGSKIVNSHDDKTGATPLYIVTEQRKLDWMNWMLRNGANPDLGIRPSDDKPLHVAAQNDFIEGAKLLLGQGAVVDIRGEAGETPLIRAVRIRNGEMVKLLMRNGADPDLADSSTGRSARDYASEDPRGRAMLNTIELVEREKTPSVPAARDPFDFSGDFLPIE